MNYQNRAFYNDPINEFMDNVKYYQYDTFDSNNFNNEPNQDTTNKLSLNDILSKMIVQCDEIKNKLKNCH